MLSAAREAQGLNIDMLAMSLKVPIKKLEALEADRYDLLPDTVFVRALASSVCRTLKIDSSPILAALPVSQLHKIKSSESGLNATFSDSASRSGRALLAPLTKPVGIAVLVFLVGMLVIALLPTKTSIEKGLVSLNDDKLGATPTAGVVAETSLPPVLSTPTQGSSVPLTASNSLSVDAQNLVTSPLQPTIGSALEPVAPLHGAANAVTGGDVLTLRALGSAWVEVVDAQGVSQLRKTMIKDETAVVSGVLPLSVVLGRADMVSVSVRGKSFDAVSAAANNIARFEVK